jgi:hypothetical protein
VEYARTRGLQAFTPDEFFESEYARPAAFDSMLLAHVAEHMSEDAVVTLLRTYGPLVRPRGRIVVMTPQERGFASDPTHVQFTDFDKVGSVLRRSRFAPERQYSFPFPRWAGRLFRHNEFVVVGRKVSP